MDKPDLLSEVFASLRLTSDLYFRADLAGPFAVEVPAERRLVRFHYLRRGSCWLRSPAAETPLQLGEGDLAILPNGSAHVLADDPARPALPLAELLAAAPPDDSGLLRHGAGAGRVELLCGFCQFDEDIEHPVIASLPAMMVLRPQDLGAAPWTLAALRLLGLESELAGEGMQAILSRLLEVLFIQALRQSGAEPETAPGYLAALADPQLSKALAAMHREAARDWTVGELARLAGMSRARFAAAFARRVGLAPIAYLTRWRLMKARRLLRESGLSTQEIAARCGYASLPSFTRRYKAAFGIGPGAYRRATKTP
ncbi:AraC family transcriptional regulator [Pelagibius marinus]|uniref:AraC family transcriptional regulator n=1 Tax=Pelagibius marinus TaxID=2762760 RepID=UPI0018730063|nr:AraC family transcriptional regulator [Pelagibius marinus]